jgi:flagellin
MERLATGKQNANAGDRSSYVAMSDTFRLDYVGTKAGIKGASVAMGYLETGMRVLDSASSLLTRLQELAVLGANNTNTTQDHEAINLEAEALAEEFNRLMTTSTYKGKDVFVTNAASEYVGLGGRGAEMTFGIGDITYTELYSSTARTIVSGPNAAATTFNISHLPSDAVVAKEYGKAEEILQTGNLDASSQYVVRDLGTDKNMDDGTGAHDGAVSIKTNAVTINGAGSAGAHSGNINTGNVIATHASNTINVTLDGSAGLTASKYAKVRTDDNAFVKGETYVIYSLGTGAGATTGDNDGSHIIAAATDVNGGAISGTLKVGQKFKIKSDATDLEMARINALIQGMSFTKASDTLTQDIEAVQAKINTARVQAGSQYAALESAVAYTTDLTAQYELGFNTVNDVNFSMETAHLAKNQILQQAATAMLAQANQGQQSLLQLIQG